MDVPTTTTMTPARLHLGCGGRFHARWLNIDLHPQHLSVRAHDVTTPLPFPDRHFDAVYHAHLLEHLPRRCALPFVRECFRVLRPGGVLRVVVPDLEQIARLYLEALPAAWHGEPEAQRRHSWAVLEMYDQVVREQPGGDMLTYLAAQPTQLAWYRLGADGTIIRQHLEKAPAPPGREGTGSDRPQPNPPPPRGREHAPALFRGWRERLLRWLLGREYPLLQAGRFRRGGEVHLWMYDRHSLRELLTAAGFADFRLMSAGDSAIPGWTDDHLDTQSDGTVAKPDSLYAEAVRP